MCAEAMHERMRSLFQALNFCPERAMDSTVRRSSCEVVLSALPEGKFEVDVLVPRVDEHVDGWSERISQKFAGSLA